MALELGPIEVVVGSPLSIYYSLCDDWELFVQKGIKQSGLPKDFISSRMLSQTSLDGIFLEKEVTRLSLLVPSLPNGPPLYRLASLVTLSPQNQSIPPYGFYNDFRIKKIQQIFENRSIATKITDTDEIANIDILSPSDTKIRVDFGRKNIQVVGEILERLKSKIKENEDRSLLFNRALDEYLAYFKQIKITLIKNTSYTFPLGNQEDFLDTINFYKKNYTEILLALYQESNYKPPQKGIFLSLIS